MFPIVDTHVHFWNPDRLHYPWLADVPSLRKPCLPADYRAACGDIHVEKMVFVQAECDTAEYREEAAWVTALARTEKRLAGLVPWAPLEKGAAVRAELAALAKNPLVKGVRRIIQYEPDPAFCLRPDFVAGVQMLADFDLSFDICITHSHLENTLRFARQCPHVRFVLDHIGKPDVRHGLLEPWRKNLKSLASLSNVWCKVSGLVTEADHENWNRKGLKPYLDHVLACFGFERTMYGGDWPVASLATDYPRWVETLDWAIHGCSATERRRLFRDNAMAFYRLDGDS